MSAAAKTIEERLAATRRRYEAEVAAVERDLAAARKAETKAGRAVTADPADADVARRFFRAHDDRAAVEERLARLTHPAELAGRLKRSERLARRFA